MNASEMMINGRAAKRVELGGAVLWEKGGGEYHVLEYVESDGDMAGDAYFVDAEIPLSIRYTYIIDFMLLPSVQHDRKIFGNLDLAICTLSYKWRCMSSSADYRSQVPVAENERLIMTINGEDTSIKIGAKNVINFAAFNDSPLTFGLFNLPERRRESLKGSVRLYGMQVLNWTNNKVFSELIPAKELESGIVGLYDKVRKKMFYNLGYMESLIAGPETNQYF